MPSLIGRRAETARISALLGEIPAGTGAALMLQGEAGIGKTALLEWAAGQAGDMRVLRATGIESELELAFSGLAELCLPLLGRLDEIPAPQAGASGPRSPSPTDSRATGSCWRWRPRRCCRRKRASGPCSR